MKKIMMFLGLTLMLAGLTSMAVHKFYAAVFQIEHIQEKKALHMTARIFVDDLEAALNKKYSKKIYLGSTRELPEANEVLGRYFSEKIQVKVNGKLKAIKYLGKETEDDILICYYTIPADTKIKSIEIRNTVLMESHPEQQNIIHTNINSNKRSLLLTNDKEEGTLEF